MAGRIVARYRVTDADVREVAEAIRVEQTIEFPAELAPEWIRDSVVGRVEAVTDDEVELSYDPAVVGADPLQLLGVLWGNVSLFEGVRLVALQLPETVLELFPGPRFGVAGVRALVGAPDRPLLATALKPLGTSATRLADLAATFAENGFDLVKDDQGLTDQTWAPWAERVVRCADAVRRANERTGRRALYLPSLNVPGHRAVEQAHRAKELGAGGLLVVPGLVGFETLRALANDPDLGLPLMAHPAALGSWVVNRTQGWRHGLVLGLLNRLFGADVTVFPNAGGRFSFAPDECADIAAECARALPRIAPALPAPGGGITLDRVDDVLASYGRDVVLLVGGAVHRGDLAANARRLRAAVEAASPATASTAGRDAS
ncbi:MAG TPA: RuBisCO large subunit C-terminal-like domain-containing protein [Kineosporiaceae bacterium]